ncbi:acyl-CoA carboxylase subunit epsilon [Microbacterium sp. BK668]|uniref:acyl-CoA carboxylase subunit epsilon n=1 Tax=Microbacterium sp. BK668 TaxID=2512118 RepID=UPI00105D69D1|nr:acyl-CoA carboxylase subunit epsilon [Microbacterium sp. BK668]TDN87859.1 acyl-CoA carboxylase epsilon subunit-like protein [Microbacterium sp. BK668]
MTTDQSGTPDEGIRLEVLRGRPTEAELAALIAVVSEAYAEEASSAVADDTRSRTAWSVSQRSLRTPLRRELGWSGFQGR